MQVKDKAGNLTVQPKLNVVCKVLHDSSFYNARGVREHHESCACTRAKISHGLAHIIDIILYIQLTGSSGLPTYLGDCSTSGKASLTGGNVVINKLVKTTKLKAKIELQVYLSVHDKILNDVMLCG